MHGSQAGGGHGSAGRNADLHITRRAVQPDHAYGHVPLQTPHQCVQQEVENHCYAIALHLVHYNWCGIHKTLRVTTAMEAGLTDDVMSIADIVKLAYPN